ncbi:hypothetical protein INR49_025423 [Caranx melampygus]|nr:hypothetical protein INR49_025423 [Caranx melampygus]
MSRRWGVSSRGGGGKAEQPFCRGPDCSSRHRGRGWAGLGRADQRGSGGATDEGVDFVVCLGSAISVGREISWQSMYPQAKPNKLISQSPLYTQPPTKRLMAGTYNPSQNNYRDANCILL